MSHQGDRDRVRGGNTRGGELLFPGLPYRMGERAAKAIGDVQLQQFVNQTAGSKDRKRKEAFAEVFGEREGAVKELAGKIRQHTLDYLDFYLEMFIDRATAAGAVVHLAVDAKQANEICKEIVRGKGGGEGRLVVKSKSMATEEIRLNEALEGEEGSGCEVVETDMGEFILQLDGDAPSHIVTPMIHKDRGSVGRTFERELGVGYTEDPAELTRIARGCLREKYRRAGVGITGGNFLVAETGSLVLCTNEGNGRMCTTVPGVHVAVVGIEKVVPRLGDLAVMMKLLARSSTAQALTVYTQVITGPRRAGERDGPGELHLVLVDNGRTEVLREETREILRCIRCGACLNACPVYRKVGGHAYGSVYSGPIGAALTPVMHGVENYADLPRASSLCGACFEACPVRIDIPGQLVKLRREMVKAEVVGLRERLMFWVWGMVLRSGVGYAVATWLMRRLLRGGGGGENGSRVEKKDCYSSGGWVKKGRGVLKGWTGNRDLPAAAEKGFGEWWRANRSGR